MDLETDAVAGAVRERVAPTRRPRSRRDSRGRRRRTPRPAATASRPACWLVANDVPEPSSHPVPDHRRSPSASCRSSTRRRRTRSRSRPARRARSPGSPGRACGFAPLGPDATMVSKLFPLAPRSRMATSSASAKACSVGDVASVGSIAASASSAIAHAARMRATSPGSFTRRSVSTRSSVGTSVVPRERLDPDPLLGPRDAVRLEPEPGERCHETDPGSTSGAPAATISTRASTPERFELLARLRLVPTVRDQHELGRRDEEHPGRAREAGEVPHVREARHEQRVAAGSLEQARGAASPGPRCPSAPARPRPAPSLLQPGDRCLERQARIPGGRSPAMVPVT